MLYTKTHQLFIPLQNLLFILHIQELHDMFYDMALLVEEQVNIPTYTKPLILFGYQDLNVCNAAK